MRCLMKNEKGLTLVEVLAAVVLISIVLMGFMALFGTTNKLAVTNSEKLVVINLADAHLERLKTDPIIYFKDAGLTFPTAKITNRIEETRAETINGKNYLVTIELTPPNSSLQNAQSLLNVLITVKASTSNLSSSVEGFVPYAKP